MEPKTQTLLSCCKTTETDQSHKQRPFISDDFSLTVLHVLRGMTPTLFFNGIYWYIKTGREYQLAQQTYIQIKSYAQVQGYYSVLTHIQIKNFKKTVLLKTSMWNPTAAYLQQCSVSL